MPLTRFGRAVDNWAIGFGRDLTNTANRALDLSSMSSVSMPIAITAGALALALLVAQSFPARR
jgi:hypothetical protein